MLGFTLFNPTCIDYYKKFVDATKTVAIAMEKNGNTKIGIQQALSHNFAFSGVTGTIKFLSWGDRISKVVLFHIQPDTQALTGYNFARKYYKQFGIIR